MDCLLYQKAILLRTLVGVDIWTRQADPADPRLATTMVNCNRQEFSISSERPCLWGIDISYVLRYEGCSPIFPAHPILRSNPYLSLQPYLKHPGLQIIGDWGFNTLVPYLINRGAYKGRRRHRCCAMSCLLLRNREQSFQSNSPSHPKPCQSPSTSPDQLSRLTPAPPAFAIPLPAITFIRSQPKAQIRTEHAEARTVTVQYVCKGAGLHLLRQGQVSNRSYLKLTWSGETRLVARSLRVR